MGTLRCELAISCSFFCKSFSAMASKEKIHHGAHGDHKGICTWLYSVTSVLQCRATPWGGLGRGEPRPYKIPRHVWLPPEAALRCSNLANPRSQRGSGPQRTDAPTWTCDPSTGRGERRSPSGRTPFGPTPVARPGSYSELSRRALRARKAAPMQRGATLAWT